MHVSPVWSRAGYHLAAAGADGFVRALDMGLDAMGPHVEGVGGEGGARLGGERPPPPPELA